MATFSFKTDPKSEAYCLEIADTMSRLFGIFQREAIVRIEAMWERQELVGNDDPIYREDQEYWGKTIYYGNDSFLWLPEEDRIRQGLGPLIPVPMKA